MELFISDCSMSFKDRLNINFQILSKIETPNGINRYFHDEKNQAMHFQIIFKVVNKLFRGFEGILSEEQKKGTLYAGSST
jgi:hypothetical protein